VAKLTDVANVERKMPRDFITPDGFHITPKCRNYLEPLIAGEAFPPFERGLPKYVRLKNVAVRKKTRSDFKL
jgi:6-phosphofructokinase 1